MNTERLLAVADAIENRTIPDLGFNMNYVIGTLSKEEGCGTVACIAGWAHVLRTGKRRKLGPWGSVYRREAKWLGLNGEGIDLFQPLGVDYETVTPAQAVAVLRHAAATGAVDWARVIEPTEASA